MYTTEINKPRKIKRRSFFLYLGASVLGIFSITKFPLNMIKPLSLLQNKLKKRMKVTVNPYAVKREEQVKKIG
jgi:hypothetical protein